MENKQLQLVTFEQAQRLKKAGFDWPTTYFFVDCESGEKTTFACCDANPSAYAQRPTNWNAWTVGGQQGTTSAPAVALALKWMRDVKGLAFYVKCESEWDTTSEKVYFCPVSWYGEYEVSGRIIATDTVNTHESAESALLDELLTLKKLTSKTYVKNLHANSEFPFIIPKTKQLTNN